MAEPSGGGVLGSRRRRRREMRQEEEEEHLGPQVSVTTVHQPPPAQHQQQQLELGGVEKGGEEEERIRKRNSTLRWCGSGSGGTAGGQMDRGVVAVVGVGPGLGFSIARRFAHEGYTVAILARNSDRLERIVKEIAENESKAQLFAIRIDCSEPKEVIGAFESVRSLGFIEVLVYNVSTPLPWPKPKFTDIHIEAFQQSLTLPCVGAFHCVQQVLPGMVEKRRGTILFTGASASVRGLAGFSEIACGKFALRALSQCLAREYQPQGIHVAHVIVDGIIQSTRTRDKDDDPSMMSPDAIADVYWQLHIQDRSAWTQELDLRPFCERF